MRMCECVPPILCPPFSWTQNPKVSAKSPCYEALKPELIKRTKRSNYACYRMQYVRRQHSMCSFLGYFENFYPASMCAHMRMMCMFLCIYACMNVVYTQYVHKQITIIGPGFHVCYLSYQAPKQYKANGHAN